MNTAAAAATTNRRQRRWWILAAADGAYMAKGTFPGFRDHKSLAFEVSGTNAMTPKRGKPHGRVWLVVAVGLFVLGSIGSAIGANAVGHADGQRSRQAFVSTSMDIALVLQRSLQHQQDLYFSAAGFVAGDEDASEEQFENWAAATHAFARYPELEGITELVMVPASELKGFAARDVADPPGPLAPNGTLVVTPAGSRPYYCLESVSDVRSGFPLASAGIDYCKTAVGPRLLSARDSGKAFYLPFGVGKNLDLAIGTPIYRDGTDPSSVDARRAAFIGWIGLQIRPSVLLASVLKGHQSTALAFHFDGSSSVTFKAGSAPVECTDQFGWACEWMDRLGQCRRRREWSVGQSKLPLRIVGRYSRSVSCSPC